jgi:hypothetical protein
MKSSLFNHLQSAIHNPQSAIALIFAAMLAVSWQRWISPITDSGREMDLPLRLMNGELLYRDVHYLYPPFSPYFNSLLYRIFGAHLYVLQASGAICAVLVVLICYRIGQGLRGVEGDMLRVGDRTFFVKIFELRDAAQ